MDDLHKHDDAERHEVLKVNAAQKRSIQPPAEVKGTSWGERLRDLEGKVTELRQRVPAGTGTIGLKEDTDALEEQTARNYGRVCRDETALNAEARLKDLEQWQTVFSELVARISVLEGVVLKLTLGEDTKPLTNSPPAKKLALTTYRCSSCGLVDKDPCVPDSGWRWLTESDIAKEGDFTWMVCPDCMKTVRGVMKK